MGLANDAPTAMVTGGTRGIGRAIAELLAQRGLQVIITYVSRREDAQKVCADIESGGGAAVYLPLDVGNPAAIEELFAQEIKDKVNLAVLVNNAGITCDGLLLRMKDEAFDRVLNVNLRGAFVCSREAAKIMSRKRQGRIINISSVVGQMGNAGQVNYSAAKAGLIGMTKACARELAPRNITVNAVAPGFIDTEMTQVLEEKVREAYVQTIPLRRLGTVRDVAEAVAFLASDAAAYITGQVIAVNGGLYT